MKLKSLTIAAFMAFSSVSAANAASSILDPLDLFPEPSSSFSTTIDKAGTFWGTFLGIFSTNGYNNVVNAFAAVGLNFNPSDTEVTFNGTSELPWQGFLTFKGATETVTFVYTTDLGEETVVSVPGPEAGAGLGALAMAGMGYLIMRRRKQQIAA